MAKKWTTLALALVLATILVVPACAASVDDINAELEAIMAKYPQSAKMVDDAKIWMADEANAEFINDAGRADAIMAEMKTAIETAGDATKLSEMSTAQRDALVASVTKAATTAGLKVNIDAAMTSIVVTDSTGKALVSYDRQPIKQTGDALNMSGFIVVGLLIAVALAVAVAAAMVSQKKTKLLNAAA